MGDMDFEGLNDGVAHTIARLSKNLNPCNYDSSGMGPGNDLVGDKYMIFATLIPKKAMTRERIL